MKRFLLLTFLSSLFLPFAAFAELSEDVTKDFSTIDGYVIMQVNDEYLVDLDARNNLHVGDVLTVIKPGKKVVHPVTKEVVGSIDVPVGFLSIVRIHSGYSYAKALDTELVVGDGSPVRRFEQVPARIVTESEKNNNLKRELEINLPHFNWLNSQESAKALLTFTIDDDSVDATTAQGNSLHKYLLNENQQLVSAAVTPQRPFVTANKQPTPKLLQQVANSVMGVFEQSNDDRFAEMDEAIIRQKQVDRQGIWLSPNLEGHPVGLAVADLDGDGQQEVATVLDETLKVARISNGQFVEVADIGLSSSLKILSVDAIDLDNNGKAELYVSAMFGFTPSSLVVEFDGSAFNIVEENIRWFVRAVSLPDKQEKSLIGQRLGNEEAPFLGDMFFVKREGGNLVKGDAIALPDQLNLFNFIPFEDERNQTNYAYLTSGDYLKVVSADGNELYESSDYFAGSEVGFNTRKAHKGEMLTPIYMRPRMIKMPGNEILVAQNDGQRMVQRFRKFKRSRVVSLSWNGFTMNEVWRTATQPGYLAEFAIADADNDGSQEIVMVVKFQHAGMVDEARSAIVLYELD